ncbi:MAG: hypothetical protein C4548_05590 [Desulfobacteraceae bacterium]|nr:MAG: hypothetical protein C4548_05590 [Desulfobacteraceae bacterium]
MTPLFPAKAAGPMIKSVNAVKVTIATNLMFLIFFSFWLLVYDLLVSIIRSLVQYIFNKHAKIFIFKIINKIIC